MNKKLIFSIPIVFTFIFSTSILQSQTSEQIELQVSEPKNLDEFIYSECVGDQGASKLSCIFYHINYELNEIAKEDPFITTDCEDQILTLFLEVNTENKVVLDSISGNYLAENKSKLFHHFSGINEYLAQQEKEFRAAQPNGFPVASKFSIPYVIYSQEKLVFQHSKLDKHFEAYKNCDKIKLYSRENEVKKFLNNFTMEEWELKKQEILEPVAMEVIKTN